MPVFELIFLRQPLLKGRIRHAALTGKRHIRLTSVPDAQHPFLSVALDAF
jgi:hypothetical protein